MAKLKFNGKTASMSNNEHWKMLIVDDDEKVHRITKTVLKSFEFEQKNRYEIKEIQWFELNYLFVEIQNQENMGNFALVKPYLRKLEKRVNELRSSAVEIGSLKKATTRKTRKNAGK